MRLVRWFAAVAVATLSQALLASSFDAARAAVTSSCVGVTDLNHDGYPELFYIRRMADRGKYAYEAAGKDKGTVIVLVESRLLQPISGARSIEHGIRTYVADLAKDGYNAFALDTQLEPGTRRQGGLTLLAIRRFLQSVYRKDPDLKGVVLVGRFPDALIVRQDYWERNDDVTLHEGKPNQKTFSGKHWVVSRPEPVATSADIVLGDMDGNWESVYHMAPAQLPYFVAVYPSSHIDAPTRDYEEGTHTFADCFFVQDGGWTAKTMPDGKVFTQDKKRDFECTPDDLAQPNPMARAEIAVSHLDASMVALKPNPKTPALTDKQGRPREAKFEKGHVPGPAYCWVPDPVLERRLLYEYFTRNHAYRTGAYTSCAKPASFSMEWDSSMPDFTDNVPGWKDVKADGLDVPGAKVSVNDWVAWMKRPALVRAIKAHTSPWGSSYGGSWDAAALRKLVGPVSWGWDRTPDSLIPATFADGGGKYELYRTLYENHILPPSPNMFLFTGCDATTPGFWDRLPFGDPNWGKFQCSEALMMYCNGLVLIGRGKVFNDEPPDVGKLLGQGKCWGDIWEHYFLVDAANARENLNNETGIRRKKAYFWSILGDWTLTIVK